jgi:uncharacterized protein YlxW (UPF0749 family)
MPDPSDGPAEGPADPVDRVEGGAVSDTDVATRSEADEPPERLRAALLRPSRSQIVVAVLLAALGYAAIVQVRTNTTDNTFAGYREQDLVNVLSALAGTSQRAQQELNQLEANRRQLEANERKQSAALGTAQKTADELAILAGLVPVTGPGIRLSVTEGPRHIDVDSVLDTIEELRSAGAEAMQINGKVRLVASSSVQANDGGLLVDGQQLTSPYVIDAIGDPHTLQGALSLFGGPIDQFKESGATVDVQPQKSLDITTIHKTPGSGLVPTP